MIREATGVTDSDTLPRTAANPMAQPKGAQGKPEFSVVVPVHNEADNVEALANEIAGRLSGRAYEMIFVDDSSQDDTRVPPFGP